jgi:hypothetical protein
MRELNQIAWFRKRGISISGVSLSFEKCTRRFNSGKKWSGGIFLI